MWRRRCICARIRVARIEPEFKCIQPNVKPKVYFVFRAVSTSSRKTSNGFPGREEPSPRT